MSKKQKIRWSKNIGNEEKTIYELFGSVSAWSGMLLDAVCAFIYIYAARLMLNDVFELGTPGSGHIISLSLTAIFISVSMQVAKCFDKRIRYSIYIGVFAIGLILSWFSSIALSSWQELGLGCQRIAAVYVEYWNEYYGTSYTVAMPTGYSSIESLMQAVILATPQALDFISFVIMYFCLWESKLRGRNHTLLIVPILVFVAELLVGYSPKQTALFLVFIAVVLGNAHRWEAVNFKRARAARSGIGTLENERTGNVVATIGKKVSHFAWVILGVCTWMVCLGTASFGDIDANKFVNIAVDFRGVINEFIEDIKNIDLDIRNDMDNLSQAPTKSELTNDWPEYEERTMMLVSTTQKFMGALYMKGFQANTYKDGVWTEELQPLYDELKEFGFNADSFAKELASLGTNRVIEFYDKFGMTPDDLFANMTIQYISENDSRAYMPYFTHITDDGIKATGDGIYKKSKDKTYADFGVWAYSGTYVEHLDSLHFDHQYQWESWYDAYISAHYVAVPSHLNDVMASVIADIGSYDYGDLIVDNESITNMYRIDQAFKIARWFQENTTYSLEPPALPDGVDPIDYFLTESKTGYCMHYASAATMLLRACNVPARYVTGYILPSDLLVETGIYDGQDIEYDPSSSVIIPVTTYYTASVKDNMAHAWVEIYLEGIGWVPVEVTKGYIDSALQGGIDDDILNPPTEQPSEEQTSEEQTSEAPTSEQQTSENETTTNGEHTSTDKGGNENNNGDGGDNSSSDDDNNLFNTLKTIIPVVLIVSIVGFVAFNIYRNHAMYMARLQSDITNKRTRLVIRRVNRRIYKRLRNTGRILKVSITDGEYGNILKKTYPQIEAIDWNRYINIVKAAAFSKADFTVEEMEFCLKIGEKIKWRGKDTKV